MLVVQDLIFGDSIYVEDPAGAAADWAITIPAKLPGAMFAGGGPDQPYPSGLAWFHAHVHGKARIDVMGGQSGMLQVGDSLADLRATLGLSAAAKAVLEHTDVVYLGLRDIQLRVARSATPDKSGSAGAVATWLKGADYSPAACPSQANPPQTTPGVASIAVPGSCFSADAGSDPPTSTEWLFTVNGQAFPTDRMLAGRNQLLRIANLSSNVSYLIQVVADAAPDQPIPMEVITIDGLVAGATPQGGSGLKVGVTLDALLLMPAGRAEVFLPALARGAGALTMRTAGITTGATGDPWPRIDLMHILAPPGPAVMAQRFAPVTPATRAFPEVVLPRQPSTAVPHVRALLTHRPNVPENCVTLPESQAVRRRVTFATSSDGSQFLLGSEVVTADGTAVDPVHDTIAPAVFPEAAMTAPQSVRHVCPRLGEQEVWELVNTTGELHNFHIHQTKFRLSQPSDPGVPQGSLAMQDPTGIIAQYVPGAGGASPSATVDVWHDTLPVPPADAQGHPGRVFVTIPFHAREQVGFFVFHCHILEHEDGGMMAVVQLFDPAHPDLGGEQAKSEMGSMQH